jgi:pimeloyl-ACP methyl ester carboxylesterase
MPDTPGGWLFAGAPVLLAALLLWRFPECRRFRIRPLLLYAILMSLLIWGALAVVARVASARVAAREIPLILWFTIGWRLAWELWARHINRLGRGWCRWARRRARSGDRVPLAVRLIPAGRAGLTGLVFFLAFFSTVATHRCKLTDGQDPRSIFNMPFESVRFPTRDGLMLDGWFVPVSPRSDRTIVVCHGAGANKGNFVWFLGALAHHGYNVLFFDFRAHGSSDGRVTTYGIRERLDVIAAVDWLKRERPGASRVIAGLGSSQGAMALALAAAEESRIDAVILDSPFVSPRELVHERARRVPVLGPLVADLLLAEVSLQTGTDFFAASAEQAVRAAGARPVMVIHGDGDIMMPAAHSRRLYEAAGGRRAIWFGPGPHSNIVTEAPAEYARRVFAFLDGPGLQEAARPRGSAPR